MPIATEDGCWCDELCKHYGDCCDDFCTYCSSVNECWCDESCWEPGDPGHPFHSCEQPPNTNWSGVCPSGYQATYPPDPDCAPPPPPPDNVEQDKGEELEPFPPVPPVGALASPPALPAPPPPPPFLAPGGVYAIPPSFP